MREYSAEKFSTNAQVFLHVEGYGAGSVIQSRLEVFTPSVDPLIKMGLRTLLWEMNIGFGMHEMETSLSLPSSATCVNFEIYRDENLA